MQKPLLTFQAAKLKFEEELQSATDISHSIVRPTAFFKSLAGQVESVQKGGPYVMFGDGQLASCKPISERDLAKYMAECIRDASLENKVLPIGGPGKAMSALEQGTMLFDILGMEPKFVKVPIEVMDGVIKILDTFAGFFANMRDAAEFGKIGRYYAAESMLVLDDATGEYDASKTPSYGTDTLDDVDRMLAALAEELGAEVESFQSNHEGELLDFIDEASTRVDGFLINPGALTHTSIALRDALTGVDRPFVECHLSNTSGRERFRRHSYLAPVAAGVVYGFGVQSYLLGLRGLLTRLGS